MTSVIHNYFYFKVLFCTIYNVNLVAFHYHTAGFLIIVHLCIAVVYIVYLYMFICFGIFHSHLFFPCLL